MSMQQEQQVGRVALRKCNREAKEKAFLKQRVGGFERNGDEIDAPLTIDPASAQYMANVDRHRTDAADTLARERERDAYQYQVATQHRFEESIARESERWATMEREAKQSDRRLEYLREDRNNMRAARVPYNSITLEYNTTQAGQALKAADDAVLERAKARENALYRHSHGTHNPITGEAW